MEETKCPIEIIKLILANVIPNFCVIKGYRGTMAEAYKSATKCPIERPIIACLFDFIVKP